MTDCTDRRAQDGFRGGFAGNWVSGGRDSRSLRRRLMAVLRMAHRVLGVSRKALRLGTLGAGGGLRPASAVGGLIAVISLGVFAVPADANTTIGGGTVAAPTGQAIAIGAGDAGCATAIGSNAFRSIAIGCGSSANITDPTNYQPGLGLNGPTVIGVGSSATGANALIFGNASASHGDNAISIGTGAVAGVAGAAVHNAIAIGRVATATGAGSTAIGFAPDATGVRSLALGFQSVSTDIDSIAQGTSASASQQNAIAVGFQSIASGINSINIGARTVAGTGALGQGSIAFGTDVLASQERSIAIGVVASATGTGATAMGNTAKAWGNQSIAFGVNAQAGVQANTAIPNSIAIGTNSVSSGGFGVAIGQATQATADFGTAIGNGAVSSGTGSVAAGSGAQSTGISSVALGNNSAATAANAVAVGLGSVANSADAVAIGTGATATGGKAVAIGAGNVANGDGAVAIGDPSTATGDGAVAQGKDNTATGNGSVAMGNTNMVGGGGQAISTPGTAAQGAVGIGYQNTVIGQGSVAIGNTSSALAAGAVAFGDTAIANNAGDVALGSGSVTAVAVGTANATINGTVYTFAGTATPGSTVSVGAVGAERTITNVAPGRISGSSTDAINGSQLFATNQAVDAIGIAVNNINTGAGIKYFHANSVLPDSQALGTDSVAIGPAAIANNAGDVAIGNGSVSGTTTAVGGTTIGGTAYTFAGANPAGGAFSVGSAGQERQIQNVAAGQLTSASTDAVNGSQLFATNQQVTVNTTDIANLGTTINNFAGDVSTVYTDANGDGIRYVRTNDRTLAITDSFAQGIAATAVGYQATAVADNSLALGRDSQATVLGGIALGAGSISDRALAPLTGTLPAGPTNIIEYNTTDKTLLGALSVGTDTSYRQITNVADGTQAQDAVTIRQLQGAIASVATTPSMYFHANSTGLDSLSVGAESIAVGPRTVVNGDNGIGIGNGAIVDQIAPGGTAIGQNAHVMLADGVALGTNATAGGIQSVALGAGATSNHVNSVALGAGSATQAAVGTASTTIRGTTYNFAGAAPVGTVSIGDVGAERTLTNVAAGRISETSTDAINGSQLYATNLALESVQGGIGAITNSAVFYDLNIDGSKKNSITLQGGDPNAPVVISNVAEGVAGTDAVNVNQLNKGVTEAKSYTDSQIANIVDNGKAYTDQKFGQLNQEIRAARQEARQAAAVGLAAASLRFDDRPGKISVAAGGGVWRNEGALAFGAGYTSENGRVRANLTGATSGGEWGVGAGVSFTLN